MDMTKSSDTAGKFTLTTITSATEKVTHTYSTPAALYAALELHRIPSRVIRDGRHQVFGAIYTWTVA